MTQVIGQVDRFGQPMPSEPGYVMFINEDGSQPRMRIRVHLDNTLMAVDDEQTCATKLIARGCVVVKQGAPLVDGNSSISVSGGSEWTLASATSRVTIACLTSGSPLNGESMVINVIRPESTIVTITDDVGTVLIDVPSGIKMSVSVTFDGTHFGSAHSIRIE